MLHRKCSFSSERGQEELNYPIAQQNMLDLHSPRPEHTQLHTVTKLKNDTTNSSPNNSDHYFLSLQERIDASLNDNKTSNASVANLDDKLLPAFSISQDENVNHSLNFKLAVEDQGFPSPPLSPKPLSELISTNDIKMATSPSWDNNMNVKHYNRANHDFLSQYKIFKNKDAMNHNSSSKFKVPRIYHHHDRDVRSRTYYSHLRSNSSSSDENNANDPSNMYPPVLSRKVTHTKPTHQLAIKRSRMLTSTHHTTPNINWHQLPDYSPSIDTLPPNNKNSLRIEWKGSQMDLSSDPLMDRLHPSELVLAQILRLPCDLYLDSKRRLFMAKVERLKNRLPFRRTDAQKACRIDVNKASRLYCGFEKVGWLKDEHFTKFT